MRAVIMAGGRGTRLAPFTKVLPKPLIPLGDYPIVEIIMCQLRDAGYCDITLAVNYLADLFKAYFGDGSRLELNVDYSLETKRLGTAGPLSLINRPSDPFLMMNADLLTDLDFADMYDFHLRSDAAITMALYSREVKIDFGVIEVDDRSRIVACREKPTYNYLVNMGIYVVSPEVLDYVPHNEYYDFTTLVDAVKADGKNVMGYVFEGEWMDLGRIVDFAKASEDHERLGLAASEGRGLGECLAPALDEGIALEPVLVAD